LVQRVVEVDAERRRSRVQVVAIRVAVIAEGTQRGAV
jgi:hypothetical protein